MPKVRLRLVAALIALSLSLIATTRFTQAQRNAIDTYTITNARIVPVSGPVIEQDSLLTLEPFQRFSDSRGR